VLYPGCYCTQHGAMWTAGIHCSISADVPTGSGQTTCKSPLYCHCVVLRRAKNITNKPRINEDPKDAMLREFQDEILRLKAALAVSQRSIPQTGHTCCNWLWF
jgi:hypothetical protein